MTNLEKLIQEKRIAFDSEEPRSGHFARFEARLEAVSDERTSVFNRFAMLKVAALILVLISVSIFIFDLSTREIRERLSNTVKSAELPLEMREAMQYYNAQAELQLGKIKGLAPSNEEAGSLSIGALKEIAALDRTTGDLNLELQKNPGNERIMTAIMQNQKMKNDIMNNILTQLALKNN